MRDSKQIPERPVQLLRPDQVLLVSSGTHMGEGQEQEQDDCGLGSNAIRIHCGGFMIPSRVVCINCGSRLAYEILTVGSDRRTSLGF